MAGAFGQMRCLPTDTLTNAHVLTCLYTVQEGERRTKEREGGQREIQIGIMLFIISRSGINEN